MRRSAGTMAGSQGLDIRNAQVLSVGAGGAWVVMEGSDDTPIRVGIDPDISLPRGEYHIGDCDWSTGGEADEGDEYDLEDDAPDGDVWVEVRRLRGGPYKITRIKGKKVETLTYTIDDVADAQPRPYVPHPSALIRWAYMTLDEENGEGDGEGPVKFVVSVGDAAVIEGRVNPGNEYSKRKRAAKLKRTSPQNKLRVEITDPGPEWMEGIGGVVVIGYTE